MMTPAAFEAYAHDHAADAEVLLRALCRIPAPTHDEGRRAAFLLDWLHGIGADAAYIDEAGSVLFPWGIRNNEGFAVMAAHTDIVFPDTEPLPLREENGRLYCPGIGDDTANVVTMLMAIRYMLENGIQPARGILFAANTCEEGLGNLKGSRRIFRDYAGRIECFISLDCGPDSVVNRAVGSRRYAVEITAQGGHSYVNFGNTSAIVQMAALISDLAAIRVPTEARTTFNVGTIEGGTTVNSIAERCRILYEYRSEDRRCLQAMEDAFRSAIAAHSARGVRIEATLLGDRPCSGDVDPQKLAALSEGAAEVLRRYGTAPVSFCAASTDANIPLSQGIPAVTFGTCVTDGEHTRGEWMDPASLENGIVIALEAVRLLTE